MIISAKEVYEIKDQTIILPFSSHKDAKEYEPSFLTCPIYSSITTYIFVNTKRRI
ncbi:uncharacterized protein METZ01_LOCUS237231 [marine metagenome]|uniref:Uncharacterized protein n=1 Tax=marine metagenome TaxID=408172 RepID=A0A382HBV9_9ZZZZ